MSIYYPCDTNPEKESFKMNNPAETVRRIQEAANQPNFRLPANCLKGIRLPISIQYVSNQTLVFEFYKAEYCFDRKSHGDKRLTVHVGNEGDDRATTVITLIDLLDNYVIASGEIDLSSGDIILKAGKRRA